MKVKCICVSKHPKEEIVTYLHVPFITLHLFQPRWEKYLQMEEPKRYNPASEPFLDTNEIRSSLHFS